MTDKQRLAKIGELLAGEIVSRDSALDWLRSTDPAVLGRAIDAVMGHWDQVQPPLSRTDFGTMLIRGLQLCIDTGGGAGSDFSFSELAADFNSWFVQAIENADNEEASACVIRAKRFLGEAIRAGTPAQEERIVASILEHLLEYEEVARLFEDWRSDPALRPSLEKALEWKHWVSKRETALSQTIAAVIDSLRRSGAKKVTQRSPRLGTGTPIVRWSRGVIHELAFACDEEFVSLAARGGLELKKVAAHAISVANQLGDDPQRQNAIVNLSGSAFKKR